MKYENTTGKNMDMMFSSPANIPFSFSVVIKDVWPAGSTACGFDIKGRDPHTLETKLCHYLLNDRKHKAYLDFYEKLTSDFGLRLPENRKPTAERPFKADYRVVLSKNMAPGMLYGYGDPAILRVEESNNQTDYYLVVTSNDAPDSFPMLRSRNLMDWEFLGYVFPQGQKPVWASDGEGISDYWAPEMHRVNDEFRIYFVAREKES